MRNALILGAMAAVATLLAAAASGNDAVHADFNHGGPVDAAVYQGSRFEVTIVNSSSDPQTASGVEMIQINARTGGVGWLTASPACKGDSPNSPIQLRCPFDLEAHGTKTWVVTLHKLNEDPPQWPADRPVPILILTSSFRSVFTNVSVRSDTSPGKTTTQPARSSGLGTPTSGTTTTSGETTSAGGAGADWSIKVLQPSHESSVAISRTVEFWVRVGWPRLAKSLDVDRLEDGDLSPEFALTVTGGYPPLKIEHVVSNVLCESATTEMTGDATCVAAAGSAGRACDPTCSSDEPSPTSPGDGSGGPPYREWLVTVNVGPVPDQGSTTLHVEAKLLRMGKQTVSSSTNGMLPLEDYSWQVLDDPNLSNDSDRADIRAQW